MKMIVMTTCGQRCRALLAAATALVVSACGMASPTPSGARTADQLNLVVAFYPFEFVAERVAGRHGHVQNLTQPGAEPHDLELTPRQVGSLSSADLVIYERTFQPAVDQAVDQSENPRVLDTATVVPLQPAAAEPAAGPGAEDGSKSGLDPHVWLDPNNLSTIADEVAKRLVQADPAHAADYTANAAALDRELTGLSRDFTFGLAGCQRTEFITTHAAFGYLARRYHLQEVGISGLSPDTEPSPRRVAAVQTEASRRGITTIFYETLASPAVARSIAGDLGLQVDVLDPIEGITPQSRGSDYVAVMRSNLTALRKANACP
jgi:zinc transport system substrate-binding protein